MMFLRDTFYFFLKVRHTRIVTVGSWLTWNLACFLTNLVFKILWTWSALTRVQWRTPGSLFNYYLINSWPQEHRGQLRFSPCLRHHEVYSWPQQNPVVRRKRGPPHPAKCPAQGGDTKETTVNTAAKRVYFKYSAVSLYRQTSRSPAPPF